MRVDLRLRVHARDSIRFRSYRLALILVGDFREPIRIVPATRSANHDFAVLRALALIS